MNTTSNAAKQRTLSRPAQCTPSRRAAHVELAKLGETRFVADAQTGDIHAIVGRDTPQMRQVFKPFQSRSGGSRRRRVTATVVDDAVTFHLTPFASGNGRNKAETSAVTYNAGSCSDQRVELLELDRVQPPT
ncbi:MAG: hypothetical protein ACJATT_000903 [Myxococcota bacterium]|jgi:hypothetical protein